MAATISNLALNILQNYDGNADMLQPFTDQLTYIDSIKDTHEQILVRLIKTKLFGNARAWATDANTIVGIRNAITDHVSPPRADYYEKRLDSLYQTYMRPTEYSEKLEELATKLTAAYINDGIPINVAQQYTTKAVKKNLINNTKNETVQILLQTDSSVATRELLTNFIALSQETLNKRIMLTGSNRRLLVV